MNSLNNFQRISSSNYIPYSERFSSSKTSKNPTTSYLFENNEKDLIISKQKTRIYELEQKEKDIENLNKKYNDLEKDYNDINDYKNRLELEIKRKDNSFNNDLSLLKNEKDGINYKLNESIMINKKLTAENDFLRKENEIKQKEIERLTQKINEITNRLNDLEKNNIKLTKENKELNNLNLKNDNEIKKVCQDNCRLSELCQEIHSNLKKSEKDKENLINVINDKNNNIDDLNNKLNSQEANIKYLNNQLDESNSFRDNFDKNMKDINIKIEEFERENAILKEDLTREKSNRIEFENRNKEINNLLISKEQQIDELNKNYESLLIQQKDINKENSEIKIEIEKYKNSCKILRNQNDNLMSEIQNIISIHENVQDKLTRKEKIRDILDDNKNIIQQSLIDLDNILSNSNDYSFN